jgi:hypothetical protein
MDDGIYTVACLVTDRLVPGAVRTDILPSFTLHEITLIMFEDTVSKQSIPGRNIILLYT